MELLRDSYIQDIDTLALGLLQIGAVELRPNQPFTWSSGWKSPIYCDNRLILGYPILRGQVAVAFEQIVRTDFPGVEVIVGTATAGIPHAAILADRLNLPNAYVRSQAKAHGQGKQIEGFVRPSMKAVVVEDTLSTGKSAYEAVASLQAAGVDVLAVFTILSYDFDIARERMEESGVPAYRLVPYRALVRVARERGVVTDADVELLMRWRESPSTF
ncbi:orotate phosphoribosyltransferase [Alicyclobacillus fastidiosus]|uniref:Orotate phosphoribosyltransferase n=1 Tax=Alicyclobacillus fastidiosus TaxID=392011 RepID=A0ABV5AH27_9BACL|nr:orotate phosphoribosyltransferase [Alicyclobacillus fastidiosus]WEH08091.1 orotate phosphoribosyltransferase [Alicyclobacillus fastidiosus]